LANTEEWRRALRLATPTALRPAKDNEDNEDNEGGALDTVTDIDGIHHHKRRPDHHDTCVGLPPSARDWA